MTNILTALDAYQIYITIAIAIICIIFIVLLTLCFKRIKKLEKRLRKLTRGVENENIEAIINEYMDKVLLVEKNGNKIMGAFDEIEKKLRKSFRKISIKRYRAFEDVGSDLSYSIAMLNELNDGFVLTGIYGRNESTSYMKPVENGKSKYELSEEEKEVLEEAMKML